MGTYKQSCIHCKTLIDRDVRFCPDCGSSFPFGYVCPTCLHTVNKDEKVCSGCGRPLYIICPLCAEKTFVDMRCEVCKKPLTVECSNTRCKEEQFFKNEKCTVCGKMINSIFNKRWEPYEEYQVEYCGKMINSIFNKR